MMYRTTRRDIVEHNNPDEILMVPYCEAQALLRFRTPDAYTAGVYGWNFDIYYVGNMVICTGYRNMPGRRPANLRTYEARARAIDNDNTLDFFQRRDAVEALLQEFIAQA